MSAVATALIGSVAGDWLRTARTATDKLMALVIAGAGLTLAGYVWSFFLPINKPLWTGSYALFTAGLALVGLAICYWVIDVRGHRGWARPFVWLGLNPLAIYFLAELVGHLMEMSNAKTAIFWGVLRPAINPPLDEMATSLVFALLTVAFWTAVAGLLDRRGIRIQV